ncbi:MAG: hypothetical protein LBS19_07650 [Clostridiales bacterium]|jgi:hypothetical protein|nr:hypothetical protein [Clostridiales bacterium]
MPILILVVSLSIGFIILKHFRNKGYGKEFEDYVKEEIAANAVKSKEIEPELYFVPGLSGLPVRADDGAEDSPALRRQREALKRAQKKMIRLPAPMTNTELKFKYGTVNIEIISEYEENFFTYIYALNGWAEALLEEGDEAGAERVLYHAVTAGAETSKTFTMLADIYYKNGDVQAMRELYGLVNGRNMPAQDKIWQYVNEYYIKMGC